MPRHCSAGGCKSRDNRETRNAGITFHKLPKGAVRRNLWITNSHRTDLWDPQTDFVYFCSKHFTSDSFELTGYSGIRRLREDAFPTVFETSPEPKRRGPGRPRKVEENQFRNDPYALKAESAKQELTQVAYSHSQNTNAEEAQNSVPTNGESPNSAERTNAVTHPSCQRSSEPAADPSENTLLHPAASPRSPPLTRPHSPSRYMRRLPPPPGFHLPKEHSYAQLCPLVWRRRCDRAIDCLEKALRQLSAARRRENRLRTALMRLREKRFKQTMLLSRNGSKSRTVQPPPGPENGQSKERDGDKPGKGANQEESEMDVDTDYTRLFEDRPGETTDWSGWAPSTDAKNGAEEEGGYCFYCGRGREDDGGQGARVVSKTKSVAQAGANDGPSRALVTECAKQPQDPNQYQGQKTAVTPGVVDQQVSQGGSEKYHFTCNGPGDTQLGLLDRPSGKALETALSLPDASPKATSQAPLSSQAQVSPQQAPPAGKVTHNTYVQYLQPGLGSQQGLLLSDLCSGEAEQAAGQQQEDLQQQVFWLQENAEGQLVVVPVPAEDKLKGLIQLEGAAEVGQSIVMSEVDFQSDVGQVKVDSEGSCMDNMSNGLSILLASDEGQIGQLSSIQSDVLVDKVDIREKMKEHLEGFHLQLSSEFTESAID